MMRILIAFVILLGSVLLGIQLSNDSGYVLITINHWIVETTLWVAVFGLLLLFVVFHLFIQLFQKISQTPDTFHQWNSRRLTQKAQATTRQGLIEYSEGYWQKAKNHLIQALPNTDTPLLNYLTAARAAQKMGDSQLRDHYLREAQQSMPEAKIAVELTQAQLQLANHQWEQALATLRHLHDLAPRHPYVLKLLMNLYEEVRDWPQLIELLPHLRKNQILSEHDFQQLQLNAYLQYIIDLTKQNQSGTVTSVFNALPKPLGTNPTIVAEYTRFLLNNQDNTTAELLLKRCLKKEFSVELIDLFGQFHCGENQLTFAESLLKKNQHSAALYLCLGRLCIAQHLWGKAKHYLEQSIELSPTPLAYAELGSLHEQLNDQLQALESYKKGLKLEIKPFTQD
jgi:HemY protein